MTEKDKKDILENGIKRRKPMLAKAGSMVLKKVVGDDIASVQGNKKAVEEVLKAMFPQEVITKQLVSHVLSSAIYLFPIDLMNSVMESETFDGKSDSAKELIKINLFIKGLIDIEEEMVESIKNATKEIE